MARPDELTFAPLGGVGEIGMNLSVYGLGNRHQGSWLAVDLGVSFGDEEHLPGIDLIMPDIRFLEKERKNLVGLVLTHAHEDHFGAIIDLWPKLKCPIYATKFSAALFEAKCASERDPPKIPITVVPSGGRIDLGPFNVEFIPVAHSIPESHALAIHTSVGTVLHTGDWKIDPAIRRVRYARTAQCSGRALQSRADAMSGELLGVIARAQEITFDYLRIRKQFGKLIGSFQALQHHAVNIHIRTVTTRSLVYPGCREQ